MTLPGQTVGAKSPHLPVLLLLLLISLPLSSCQTTTPSATSSVGIVTSSSPLSSLTSTITATLTTSTPSTTSPATTIRPVPTTANTPSTSTRALILTTTQTRSSASSSSPSLGSGSTPSPSAPAPGCGPDLDPIYWYLCDRQAVWGIVVESLASLGFVVSIGMLLGLLLWSLWRCCCCCGAGRRCCRRQNSRCGGAGGSTVSLLLFLLGTAGLFALTFAFVVRLTPQTCPTRIFLFGVLSALCFSALLSRGLALLGFGVARGGAEPVVILVLTTVQVIIAVEWLLMVLVRHELPCSYEQDDFAMLLIYVLCLLAVGLVVAVRLVWRTRRTYGYSYRHTSSWSRASHTQAVLLLITTLLAIAIWVVWIALLTRGNPEMNRRPSWDDPVLSVALVATGWVLLLGHGLSQLAFLCRGEARSKDSPLDFTSWTSPSPGMGSLPSPKEGRDNGSFENDGTTRRGTRPDPVLRSPYESGYSMTEIDPDKDYSIPRPQTTNINEPYDEYYGPRQV